MLRHEPGVFYSRTVLKPLIYTSNLLFQCSARFRTATIAQLSGKPVALISKKILTYRFVLVFRLRLALFLYKVRLRWGGLLLWCQCRITLLQLSNRCFVLQEEWKHRYTYSLVYRLKILVLRW